MDACAATIASWVIRVSVGWLMVDIDADLGRQEITRAVRGRSGGGSAPTRATSARQLQARGAAYGYLGVHTLGTTAGALRKTLRLVKPAAAPDAAGARRRGLDTGTLAGRWELEHAQARALGVADPLVSVGAPRLIAQMARRRMGKPVTITMGAATVEVTTDGKPPERLSLKGAAEVETPGGAVTATARVQRGGRALVVKLNAPVARRRQAHGRDARCKTTAGAALPMQRRARRQGRR